VRMRLKAALALASQMALLVALSQATPAQADPDSRPGTVGERLTRIAATNPRATASPCTSGASRAGAGGGSARRGWSWVEPSDWGWIRKVRSVPAG